jgi:hypothetical protein
MRGRRRRALGALCLLALLAALFAPAAGAINDPLQGGSAKLRLDKRFGAFLKADGIKLTATAPAKRRGPAYLLAVSGGSLDPSIGRGEIETEGVLAFAGARGKLPLREIAVKTTHAPLVAKLGGSQLKLATSASLSFERVGFGGAFTAAKLKLSEKAATRLNKKLRPKVPFSAGQPLGTLIASPQPRLVAIAEGGGGATISFDPAFLQKLEGLFVSVNPIHPAEHTGPSFSFPLTPGGQLSPQGTEGTLRAGGAIEMLQLGGGQLFWQEPWLDLAAHALSAEADLEPTPAFPGKVGRIGVLDAAPGAFGADPKGRGLSEGGIALTLSPSGAAELNQAFAQGQGAFGVGEAVGGLGFAAVGE